MRTQNEILKRIEEIKEEDLFGTETSDLIDYLDFENAKSFLKKETTKQDWRKMQKKTDKDISDSMKNYIDFAWEKAADKRGLSSNRSLMHYSAWIWLLNDGNFEDFTHQVKNNYSEYGKPVLTWICNKYKITKPKREHNEV